MNLDTNIAKFIQKVAASKQDKLDLSADEDLSIAIMNLISIEEHFFFTAGKTGKSQYYDFLNEIREMRKELLKKIIKDYEGEIWCISKHLLAASMRLMEVGTKLQSQHKSTEAKDMFAKSYQLYSLFWGLNLKLLNVGEIKQLDENQLNKQDNTKNGVSKKLGELVKKVIDCCRE